MSPVQKIYGGLSNLSATGASLSIKNALKSAAGSISKQVNGVVTAAIANTTAAVKSLVAVPQNIINSFKGAGEALTKQGKNIKSIITDELDCIKNSINITATSSTVQSTINREALKTVSNLSNNELKQLSEDTEMKQKYIDSITNNVIESSSSNLINSLASNQTQQVLAVNKLKFLT